VLLKTVSTVPKLSHTFRVYTYQETLILIIEMDTDPFLDDIPTSKAPVL
jgi:hypothetical protein